MKNNHNTKGAFKSLFTGELIAINQYVVHAELCEAGGFTNLFSTANKRLAEKIEHAENLVERILFLEGINELGAVAKISVGSGCEKWFENDLRTEIENVTKHIDAVIRCADTNDREIKVCINCIVSDEQKHLAWLKSQLVMITLPERKTQLTS